MKLELRSDETIVRTGFANLQRGLETVGGRLWLTNRRLFFAAHDLNIQREPAEIDVADIRSLRPCWTRFLGWIPILPNSLAVSTAAGTEHRLVLHRRRAWSFALAGARMKFV